MATPLIGTSESINNLISGTLQLKRKYKSFKFFVILFFQSGQIIFSWFALFILMIYVKKLAVIQVDRMAG
ncbi:MAG: hypothetical protein OET81_10065 [Desulfobacteraceae bacterium]|nr:hypothetical protein [Desulfobacteraceae bacterium]MDH3723543.1 hypothetical protein [Desulfobacteraceae bacterium]MDH3837987.1 hypothetical protein [Desulfobacteraceae bacterium]MDH3957028.1 hypothetical protein [Desulfobacteraceae bacterium]